MSADLTAGPNLNDGPLIRGRPPSVVTAYENRIAKLEKEKLLLGEQLADTGQPTRPFREMFEHSMAFFANPCNLWASERFEDKRAVLRLTFSERLAYCRKSGFRTPKTTLPFKVLGQICRGKMEMVPLA